MASDTNWLIHVPGVSLWPFSLTSFPLRPSQNWECSSYMYLSRMNGIAFITICVHFVSLKVKITTDHASWLVLQVKQSMYCTYMCVHVLQLNYTPLSTESVIIKRSVTSHNGVCSTVQPDRAQRITCGPYSMIQVFWLGATIWANTQKKTQVWSE